MKILKWIGIGLGGLLALAVLVLGGAFLASEARLNQKYTVTVQAVTAPVPEPTVPALLLAGLVALAWARHRR